MNKWKYYFFNSYFQLISMWFYSNFNREDLLDVEFNSTFNEYPLGILFKDPSPRKTRNTWKNMMLMSTSHFFMYFLFFVEQGSPKEFIVVLVGCGIEFPIQRVLSIEICVKPHGDKLKMRVEKVVCFFFSSKIWWGKLILFYYFHYYFIVSLRRPILDLKIPLMLGLKWEKRP